MLVKTIKEHETQLMFKTYIIPGMFRFTSQVPDSIMQITKLLKFSKNFDAEDLEEKRYHSTLFHGSVLRSA